MNKRIYCIFLPVLAILFSIFCSADNAIFFQQNAPGLNITKVSAGHSLPFSSGLKKGDKKVNINAIRVKAKHDATATHIPAHWESAASIVYYAKSYFSSYSACELHAHLKGYNLRGPPSVI